VSDVVLPDARGDELETLLGPRAWHAPSMTARSRSAPRSARSAATRGCSSRTGVRAASTSGKAGANGTERIVPFGPNPVDVGYTRNIVRRLSV
jgi:hypothetical protein